MLNINELNSHFKKKKSQNRYDDIVTMGYLYNYYEVNKLRREVFKLRLDIEDFRDELVYYQCFNKIILYDMFCDDYHEKLCGRFSDARQKKCKRYADKVCQLLSSHSCIFGTLTLNDDNINVDDDTMRKRIQRFFKNLNCRYICNVDYGFENERKHYHFIADVKHIDCNLWKYGYSYFEPIKNKKEFALSDYINKMCNHAMKQTTKNKRIMCNF